MSAKLFWLWLAFLVAGVVGVFVITEARAMPLGLP